MSLFVSRPFPGSLRGEIRVPSDKSLSHRAVLFAAMASGTSHLTGVLDSADVRSTIDAVSVLGASVEVAKIEQPKASGLSVAITGWGDTGPKPAGGPIDCGNSGTTARLILGVLAGWPVTVTLVGDKSLSTRPMRRVTDPLTSMGASFQTNNGCLPVTVTGGRLSPIEYVSPVASAQVKSAVLLAGLRASGSTIVVEPAPSRDHTERLLPMFGAQVDRDLERHAAWVTGPVTLQATNVSVPADPSSAAFPVVAALLVPGSQITVRDVTLNPTRTGFLRVLLRMGADIDVSAEASTAGEPTGSITVRHTPELLSTTVTAEEVPSLVDEIPILAVAAAAASGTTRFEGVSELRVKESDRLEAIRSALLALGVRVRVIKDTLEVEGARGTGPRGPLFGPASLDSLGDHRLAMAWAVAGLVASGPVSIDRFEAVDVSYPEFAADMARLAEGTS